MRLNISSSASVNAMEGSSSSGEVVNADGLRIVVGKLELEWIEAAGDEIEIGPFRLVGVVLGMREGVAELSAGKKNLGTAAISVSRSCPSQGRDQARKALFVCSNTRPLEPPPWPRFTIQQALISQIQSEIHSLRQRVSHCPRRRAQERPSSDVSSKMASF